MYPKWKPAPKADLPMPRVGEAVTMWRAIGQTDYTGWIMGHKVTRFEELKVGDVFIMDSPFFDTMSIIKICPGTSKALCEQGLTVLGVAFDPQDALQEPLNASNAAIIHANVVYGDDLFSRDFYHVNLKYKLGLCG
jgi:hypothetical protein